MFKIFRIYSAKKIVIIYCQLTLVLCACRVKEDENPRPYKRDAMASYEQEKKQFAFPTRAKLIKKLKSEHFDVLIIGGGATGAGALLDAASRGLNVALVERDDFAAGTSSRSTKLVHGGVRYLENAVKNLDRREFALVTDALKERKIFLDNAPHLTNPLPIITPVYSWLDAIYYFIGLKVYDVIAGRSSIGSSEFIFQKEALKRFPMLKKNNLKGAVVYFDGQFNDARMNLTVVLSALREGGTALNHIEVTSLIKEQGKTVGAIVKNRIDDSSWPVRAKIVINATGPFADNIRKMDQVNAAPIMLPSQGSHLLLEAEFSPPDTGLVIPKTDDGRVLFLLPWLGKTIVGTTDHAGKPTFTPKATNDEIEYILAHVRKYFDVPVKRENVLASWSGFRPLANFSNKENLSQVSRDHLIETSKSNLITIVGGKWTTFRKMGQDAIEAAINAGDLSPKSQTNTQNLKLVGAKYFKESLSKELQAFEKLPVDISVHLANSYGDRVEEVIDIAGGRHKKRLIKNFPYIEAEVIYAVRNEYALSVVDVIARRMRLAFLDNAAANKALPKIVALMGRELGWDRTERGRHLKAGREFLGTMITKPVIKK
jgi:glycerol-3-phosphate dehydrogenase